MAALAGRRVRSGYLRAAFWHHRHVRDSSVPGPAGWGQGSDGLVDGQGWSVIVLETIVRQPDTPAKITPLVFVHGFCLNPVISDARANRSGCLGHTRLGNHHERVFGDTRVIISTYQAGESAMITRVSSDI
jgi:hypothetical protein